MEAPLVGVCVMFIGFFVCLSMFLCEASTHVKPALEFRRFATQDERCNDNMRREFQACYDSCATGPRWGHDGTSKMTAMAVARFMGKT